MVAGFVNLDISDQEKEADHANLHHVKTGEKLIDCSRKQESTGVMFELGDVKSVVAVYEPEKTKGNDVEDEDQGSDC